MKIDHRMNKRAPDDTRVPVQAGTFTTQHDNGAKQIVLGFYAVNSRGFRTLVELTADEAITLANSLTRAAS